MSDPLREFDEQFGHLASTKTARALGWLAVAAWCAFLAYHLMPLALS